MGGPVSTAAAIPLIQSSWSTSASTALATGPTTAIRKSAPGVRASSRSLATPPSSHRVIPSTPMWFLLATTAWAISWPSSETSSSTALVRPTRA